MSTVFSRTSLKNKKAMIAVVWFLFTTALGSWWVYFSYRQYSSLSQTSWENSENVLKYQKMLVQEGLVFLILVILGGGALIYYFLKESRLLQERETFFAAFTHDLKTTIATHRLSLENSIQVNRSITPSEYKKMFAENQSLGLKLENALMLSQYEKTVGFSTEFKFSEVVSSVRRMWPELEVSINRDVTLKADKVFLTSVLMNLFQNAIQHAQATEIHIEVSEHKSQKNKTCLEISSNGKNFEGDTSPLGRAHYFRGTYRGSGLGLYISRNLMQKINGNLSFHNSTGPLSALIEVPSVESNRELKSKQVVTAKTSSNASGSTRGA